MSDWSGEAPVVSVLCDTYQHAPFIEEAIAGILGQQTDFPFEVLIRDDASTDGTADIVADFARRYPNIIRPILEASNRWPTVKPYPILQPLARGEFIAMCEGDDYWIDPRKLAVQAETLRRLPEAVLSHHDSISVEDGRVVVVNPRSRERERFRSGRELQRGFVPATASTFYRNVDESHVEYIAKCINGDLFRAARLGSHGGAAFEAGLLPSVYRHHPGGIWSQAGRRQNSLDTAVSLYWIACYFADRDEADLAEHYLSWSAVTVADSHLDIGLDPRAAVARRLGWVWRLRSRASRDLATKSPRIHDLVRSTLRRWRRER